MLITIFQWPRLRLPCCVQLTVVSLLSSKHFKERDRKATVCTSALWTCMLVPLSEILFSDNPGQCWVVPATMNSIWYELDCFLIVQSRKRAIRESYSSPLPWAAGRLSGGHLGDLWRGQFDPGKANFQPFSATQSSKTNVVPSGALETS